MCMRACVCIECMRHVADGEADDRCAAGASQRHTEESSLCGDADGFCPTGPYFPREQVRFASNASHWVYSNMKDCVICHT